MTADIYRAYMPLLRPVRADRNAFLIRLAVSVLVAAAVMVIGLLAPDQHVGSDYSHTIFFSFCGVLVIWLASFSINALRQHRPEYACLVPGLRQRLMRVTVVLAIIGGVLPAILFGLLFGHFGYALTGAGLAVAYLLLMQRFIVLTFLPAPLCFVFLGVGRHWGEQLWAALAALGEPLVTLILVPLDLLAIWFAVRLLYPRGGDSHWRWYQRRQNTQEALRGRPAMHEHGKLSIWRASYTSALKRDSTGAATPADTVMHVLGPKVSAMGCYGYCVFLVVITVGATLVNGPSVNADFFLGFSGIMQVTIALAPQVYAEAARAAMAQRTGEQGLYRLTPRAPAPAALNRLLFKTLLGRYLRVWLVATACNLCLTALGGAATVGTSLLLAALSLPFACLMLRDYTRMRAAGGEWQTIAGTFILMFFYMVVLSIAARRTDVPWLEIATVIAVVTVGVLRLQWLRVVKAPPAFPACRLAV